MENVKRVVFIVSTGRCGSQMLAKLLGLHPEILALHEPQPWLNLEAFFAWSGSRDSVEINQRISGKRSTLIAQVVEDNQLIYVESSNFLSHLIPQLDELFEPDFIYLYRNGRDFVRSGLSRPWYKPVDSKTRIANFLRRRFAVEVGYSFIDHRLRPPKCYGSRLQKCTWLWAEINRVILNGLATVSEDRRFQLRLEDLGENVLREVLGFIGVDASSNLLREMLTIASERPNATPKSRVRPTWGVVEEQSFEAIAGSVMHQLGYD
jgi:hypothetical protein